jgi:hypothetical protein
MEIQHRVRLADMLTGASCTSFSKDGDFNTHYQDLLMVSKQRSSSFKTDQNIEFLKMMKDRMLGMYLLGVTTLVCIGVVVILALSNHDVLAMLFAVAMNILWFFVQFFGKKWSARLREKIKEKREK